MFFFLFQSILYDIYISCVRLQCLPWKKLFLTLSISIITHQSTRFISCKYSRKLPFFANGGLVSPRLRTFSQIWNLSQFHKKNNRKMFDLLKVGTVKQLFCKNCIDSNWMNINFGLRTNVSNGTMFTPLLCSLTFAIKKGTCDFGTNIKYTQVWQMLH